MDTLQERIQWLRKTRPVCKEILDFYEKIKGEQERMKPSLNLEPIVLKEGWKDLLTQEGFPLIQRDQFPLDVDSSVTLFQSLCRIAREANPYLSEQVDKIEEALAREKVDLKNLLKEAVKERRAERIADQFGFATKVFVYLVENSVKPSVEAGVKQIAKHLKPETWSKGICPICGSLPSLSLFQEETGKRSLLCSYCGYRWSIERLICPYCGEKDPQSLGYFCAEGEESPRIDTCEKCRRYIKTLDLRKMEVYDPWLEDLATLHLDLLASQKGYRNPVPNPWIP